LNVTFIEEAIGDLVEALTYLNEHNPTAAANLDAEVSRCMTAWLLRSTRVLSHGSVPVL
jgi:hypothetical protein